MSDFGYYKASDLLNKEFPTRDFLVRGLLRDRDSILLVGDEKSGKSLIVMQLMLHLTVGKDFLGLPITEACDVSYIQIEGELPDTQDRIKRLMQTVPCDPTKLFIMFSKPLSLELLSTTNALITDIAKHHHPRIIVIDPVYFAMSGGLSDDEHVRAFLGNIRILKDHFNAAVILVHHTHRVRRTQQGDIIYEGDEAIFGSKYFKAWADQVFLFTMDKQSKLCILSCSTQRRGDIISKLHLKLHEPEPLRFELAGDTIQLMQLLSSDTATVMELIKQGGTVSLEELQVRSGIALRTLHRILSYLLEHSMIRGLPTRPKKFMIVPKGE